MLQLLPEHSQVLQNLGILAHQLGRVDEAIDPPTAGRLMSLNLEANRV